MTTRLPPALCPHCGAFADAATHALGGSGPDDPAPRPGDFSICITCATILRFGPDLHPRIPAAIELDIAEAEIPGTRATLERMAALVVAINQTTGRARRRQQRSGREPQH